MTQPTKRYRDYRTSQERNIVLPLVHLGGTSKAQLIESVDVALGRIRIAERDLRAARPNARDYRGAAMDHATTQHNAMERKLREVRIYLVAMLEGIQEQGQ